MILIRGNHDARSTAPKELGLDVHALDLRVGPFVLTHHPRTGENGYVVSGHLHPAFRLSRRYDSLRLPCYWLRTSALVLPAFGAFTGAHDIMREAGDRVFVVTEDRVLRVP
jgi:metallophosphoesterase superfamily enzyme